MKLKQKITWKSKEGITLIALVITIVVLLILAGVSLNLVLNNNGILERASNAKEETVHSQVYERLVLETQNYFIESNAGTTTYSTLIKYLQGKGILDDNNVVNVEKLLGSKQSVGNGTIDTGDVYVLEETAEVARVASVENNLKIAETTSSSVKQYRLMYYDTNLASSLYIGLVPGFGETGPVDESKLYYGDSSIEPTDQKYFDWTLDTDTMTATLEGVNQQYKVTAYYVSGYNILAGPNNVGMIDENGNAINNVVIPYSVTYGDENYVVTKIGFSELNGSPAFYNSSWNYSGSPNKYYLRFGNECGFSLYGRL